MFCRRLAIVRWHGTRPSPHLQPWRPIPLKPQLDHIPGIVRDLSKSRLAILVGLTTMCGYAMSPYPASLTTLFWTTVGTGLCIGSANALNQWMEVPFDARMTRTQNRILVTRRHGVTPLMAVAGGVVSSIAGVEILHVCVNDVVAALGAANIVLYAGIYTTLKRRSTINTWVGAVVGALPPMMGWAACSGGLDAGAWVMGWLLYAWQFPHFNALSWSIRGDYARAGYRMAVVEDPKWNARVSLRYSLGLVPVSVVAPLLDMTDWWFMLDSGLVNVLLCERAWRFYKERNDETAKKLFFASLVYLPVVLALMLLHKKKEEKEQV